LADPVPPARGEMRLYGAMDLPFAMGRHRLTTRVDTSFSGGTGAVSSERQFEVGGPRFTLAPDEVASVIPPRNASGAFAGTLPQIVLGRRTLPWERTLGAPASSGPPPAPGDPPAIAGDAPWLALLVFSEPELTLLERVPLAQIVPDDVLARLGRPAGVVCDAIEADTSLLSAILPSREELALLAHVRQVNVEDRALAGKDPDGWFAVVVANRLPESGSRTHAVLVSLEQRTDVVPVSPPSFVDPTPQPGRGGLLGQIIALSGGLRASGFDVPASVPPARTRLVALHHWAFDVATGGTFRDRIQALDVGLMGDLRDANGPPVTDTGHQPLDLHDRAGSVEQVWYRGPLVSRPLTRDPLGPYHSADQARRVSPETGAEDISYAAAFEVGRLLAAADARLAQELMRWRRGAYDQSGRVSVVDAVRTALPLSPELAAELPRAIAATVAVGAVARLAAGAGASADPSGLVALASAPGLNPVAVAQAWHLSSAEEARTLLAGTAFAAPIANVAHSTATAPSAEAIAALTSAPTPARPRAARKKRRKR
jgi:hypothetical protein